MTHNAYVPDRRSIRLPCYDYSQPGAYFITICPHRRRPVFGEIVGVAMRHNRFGEIVSEHWSKLPEHLPYVELDAFVVMPNHVHGIIVLRDENRAGLKPAPTGSSAKRHGLPDVVRAFKTFSSRRINALRQTVGTPVWQRGYYEHVLRGELDLDRVRYYIVNNPAKWADDHDNPANFTSRKSVGAGL